MADKLSKAERTLERILDAALACYEGQGIGQTRLEDVAKAAGIGRTTLYRYVGSRDDLLNKVVGRDAARQQAEMALLNRSHDSFADSLVESVLHVMRGRRNRPINRLLFGSDDDSVMERVKLSPANFYAMAEALLAEQFQRARDSGQIREGVTLADASQWISRVILSLVTYPDEFLNDEDRLRAFLRTFLVPSLVRDQ